MEKRNEKTKKKRHESYTTGRGKRRKKIHGENNCKEREKEVGKHMKRKKIAKKEKNKYMKRKEY